METKKRKQINLLELQKQLEKVASKKLKGYTVVGKVPLTNSGFPRTDKHYITQDAYRVLVEETADNRAAEVVMEAFK